MGRRTGQGLSDEMQYLLEFGEHRTCNLCGVRVFRRQYRTVNGIIPRHRRLSRIVAERRYSGPISIQCCRRCCSYLDELKREYLEQERQARLQHERQLEEQARNKRVPFILRIDCIDIEKTKAALIERYGDRIRVEEHSPQILRAELAVLGWWSWLPVDQGGDQFFFEALQNQGLIRGFQKYPFPTDDRELQEIRHD